LPKSNWQQRLKRLKPPRQAIPPDLAPVVSYCAELWGVPALKERICAVSNSRMTVTLAHAYPATDTIRISTRVMSTYERRPEDPA
jgi:hypothetical protein